MFNAIECNQVGYQERLGNFSKRQTQARPNQAIQLTNAVIVSKKTKVELDLQKFNLSQDELRQRYLDSGIDAERIYLSHLRQCQQREQLIKSLGSQNFIDLDDVNNTFNEKIKFASAIIALGGDNHFQRVARAIRGSIPLIGVNSDPATSRGALLNFTTQQLLDQADNLANGLYTIENWSRLDIMLDGKLLPPILCEAFFGERERRFMSRYKLELGQKVVEHKSSGLLTVTGAGSTGWFKGAAKYISPNDLVFGKSANYARFVATEMFDLEHSTFAEGRIESGTPLKITSLNDSDGIIALDSWLALPFPMGSVAEVSLAPEPLRVIAQENTTSYQQALITPDNIKGRVGILGGSFDPVHIDHIQIAKAAKITLNLDQIILMPTPQNPLKSTPMFSDQQRLEMLCLAAEPENNIYVSDFEMRLSSNRHGVTTGASTVDTLKALKKSLVANAELYFLVGNEAIGQIAKWHDYHQLFTLAQFVPIIRAGSASNIIEQAEGLYPDERAQLRKNQLPCVAGSVSSTQVRHALSSGIVPGHLLPEKVAKYLEGGETIFT